MREDKKQFNESWGWLAAFMIFLFGVGLFILILLLPELAKAEPPLTQAQAQARWKELCPFTLAYSDWLICTTSLMGEPKVTFPQCKGNLNAECLYKAMAELHPRELAPNGQPWQVLYYQMGVVKQYDEACKLCLRTLKNRKRCGC